MRIKNSGNDPKLLEWDNWLQQCGDGELQNVEGTDDYITLKQEMCSEIDDKQKGKSIKDSIFFTYGDIKTQSSRPQWTDFASERAILASRHEEVNRINRQCLQNLSGEEVVIPSIDSPVNIDDVLLHPVEYINSLEDAGIPPHNLVLKKGAIVMCLRNLDINGGLANGTRQIVEEIINGRLLK